MEKGRYMNIEVKIANSSDQRGLLDEILRVEEEAWPEEVRATREKFISRLNIFPEGFFLAYLEGKLTGVLTSEIINFDINDPPVSWEGITDNGLIESTHYKGGNALYVVSLGVSKLAQGRGLGSCLLEEARNFIKNKRLDFLVLGARIPGYHQFHEEHPTVDVKEYLRTKKEGTRYPIDSEIRFYTRNRLRVLKIVPNYMEDDPESENYGAVMIWENSPK